MNKVALQGRFGELVEIRPADVWASHGGEGFRGLVVEDAGGEIDDGLVAARRRRLQTRDG